MPKTVAIIGSFAPSLVNFRGSLIKAMVDRGHAVVGMAPDFDADTLAKLRALGAVPKTIELERSGLNPSQDLRSYRRLRAAIADVAPDVVIPYTIKPVIWGSLAAHAEKVARIMPMITGLGYAFTTGLNPARLLSLAAASLLYRIALSRAHFVLFQNPDDLALFQRRHLLARRTPTAIIAGSGIDTQHFARRPVPADPSFLMISRLLRNKGVREFAAAARMLKEKYPTVPIRLAGYFDNSSDSIGQAEFAEMIANGVEFLGQIEDVRPSIERASVYVLPSYREGTPRSSLEAMSVGRAIVTTDAPGCRETVVNGRNGYLVPPQDSIKLAEAMERFVKNPTLASEMGAVSRHIAETKYDVRRVNEDIMRYADLLDD